MGESQFSQSLLSEIIQAKETELTELKKHRAEAEEQSEELNAELAAQKAVCEEIDTWAERFDKQSFMEKKAMLIKLIDHIIVRNEKNIEMVCRVDFTRASNSAPIIYENSEIMDNTADFSCPQFANRYQHATWLIASPTFGS